MPTPAATSVFVQPNKRSIILPGVAADRFYTFQVRAYRRVDADIAAGGAIYSNLIGAKSAHYQPLANVAFAGDVTGTIMSVAASQVISDLAGITSDGILSRGEKPSLVTTYNQIAASVAASAAKAVQLGGLDSARSALLAAKTALDVYLNTLSAGGKPAWNDFTGDTPGIVQADFQTAFAAVAAKQADLDASLADRASQLANWGGVTGPGKPEDGATVGGSLGNDMGHAGNIRDSNGNLIHDGDVITGQGTSNDTHHVGGIPVDTVLENIDDITTRQDQLEATYGSTAAAAASAAAAATSATSAQGYRDTANTAATNATAAQGAAQTALTAAQSAQTAAQTAATNSDTARAASVAAQTAAETARTQAQTSATNAGNSATAAAGSATTASTGATNSSNSAAAAAASQVSANINAVKTLPDRYDGTGDYFVLGSIAGSPSSSAGLPSNATAAGYGPVYQQTVVSGSSFIFTTRAVVPATPGKIYKFEVEYQQTAIVGTGNASTTVQMNVRGLDASYASVGAGTNNGPVMNGSVQTMSVTVSDTASAGIAAWPAGSVWLRPYAQAFAGGATSTTVQIRRLTITDVTAQTAASNSANAAATSASSAAGSATAAGTSASAASTSATNASTSASNANTYATNASNSATSATGSASTATTQAGVATTAATNAGTSATNAATSATAASTSASNAASSATTAGQQATAAQTSATAANTSAGNASTSAGQASTSATNASGSASAAASSATVASNSASDAMSSLASTFPQSVSAGIFTQAFTNYADGSLPANTMSTDGKTIQLDTAAASYPWGAWCNSKIVWAPGRKYQLVAVIKKVSGSAANYAGAYLTRFNAAKANSGNVVLSPYVLLDGTVQTLTWTYDTTTSGVAGEVFRLGLLTNRDVTGANLATAARVDVTALYIRDITEQSAAAGSASAAASSASTASTSATNASTSASAAQTSATNASTSAGNASTSATTAATSATNAAGSANTASTQATNASNSATAAAGSATAASGSASTASTQATNASNSASAALASQVSASSSAAGALQSAAATFPSDFTQEGKFWQAGYTGDPATRVSIQTNATFRFPTVTGIGKVFEVDGAGSTYYSSIGVMKAQAGRRYRVTMTARVTNVPVGSPQFACYLTYLNDAYNQATNISTGSGILTQNTWVTRVTEVSGDTVIAAGGVYIRPIFAALNASNTYQLASCKFEDVTDQFNAAGSATAAATSASNASTSATNAGTSATAASGSATAANTSAGNASSSASTASTQASNANTSATNASNSATAAAGSAVTASTQAGNASTSATNAQSFAAASSASAAAALSSANLAATIGANSINVNPLFNAWANASNPPDNWSVWAYTGAATRARVTSPRGGFAIRDTVAAAEECGHQQSWNNTTAMGQGTLRLGWYVLEAEVRLISGSLAGSSMLLQGYNSSNSYQVDVGRIDFFSDPDSSGNAVGAGVAGTTYRFAKLVRLQDAAATEPVLFALSNWAQLTRAAKVIEWYRASFRAATDQEIASQAATSSITSLSSRVTTTEGALVTVNGKVEAYAQKEVVAGAAAAFISFRAKDDNGTLTSDVAIGASNISLYNQTTAGWTLTLQMVGGNAVFTGGLQAGAFIRLGSGQGWPVALKSKDFLVSDGDVVSFGTDLGALPALDFKQNNLAPLSAGETYKLYADSLTSTGFTARLRILTPASPSNYDLTTSTAPGSGPTLQIDKSSSPDATDGNYRLQFSGTITLHSSFIPD
jgi:hypothetical protein